MSEFRAADLKDRGYSADVRMQLSVNGHTIRIRQLGPDFLILDDSADHPAGQGKITVSIDGQVKRWQVQLPDGVSGNKPETRTSVVPIAPFDDG